MIENNEIKKIAKLQYRINALHAEANLDRDTTLNEKVQEIYGWIASYLFWLSDAENVLPFNDFWDVVAPAILEIYQDEVRAKRFMAEVLSEN